MSSIVDPSRRLTEKQIAEVVRRLVTELGPRAVYLFGSHVRGTPHADSDVDVLVTVDDELLEREDQDERGYRCLRGLFLPIELHFLGQQRFERRAGVPGSFEHEVREKGRLLYAA